MSSIETQLKDTVFYPFFQEFRLRQWKQKGCPIPPPNVVKQRRVYQYAQKYGIDTLVETGTYLGDMIASNKRKFKHIYSIELSHELHERAQKRFSSYPYIYLLEGDSTNVLSEVLSKLKSPALFWLDAHNMDTLLTARAKLETPIVQEIQLILDHAIKQHVILIDDARFFNGQHDYPTLDALKMMIEKLNMNYLFEVQHDAICLTPR